MLSIVNCIQAAQICKVGEFLKLVLSFLLIQKGGRELSDSHLMHTLLC